MDGLNYIAALQYPWAPFDVLSAQSDFNGDGKSDVLLRNVANGNVQAVLMDGITVLSMGPEVAMSGWTLVSATNDFNGDGNSDPAFVNAAGTMSRIALMDGVSMLEMADLAGRIIV